MKKTNLHKKINLLFLNEIKLHWIIILVVSHAYYRVIKPSYKSPLDKFYEIIK